MSDGADVNAKGNGGNPLLLTASYTDIEILRYLLENGMNPNMKDNYEWSLLHKLTCESNIDSIKLLLKFGADMYLKDKSDNTPFAKTLRHQKYDFTECFILNGYVPSDEDFSVVLDLNERASVRTHFMFLAAQIQEHKERLTEEVKTTEFAYADEVIEM